MRRRSPILLLPLLLLLCGTIIPSVPSTFPSSSSSFSSIFIHAAAAADSTITSTTTATTPHHEHRSLWELSVVWDKLGCFVAQLTSGWGHKSDDEEDECEKKKKEKMHKHTHTYEDWENEGDEYEGIRERGYTHKKAQKHTHKTKKHADVLSGVTSLSSSSSSSPSAPSSLSSTGSNTTTITTTTTPTVTEQALDHRQEEEDEEEVRRQLKEEGMLRALKAHLVEIGRSHEVTKHELVWGREVGVSDDEEKGSSNKDGTTNVNQEGPPVLLGESMEHYIGWISTFHAVPGPEDEDENDETIVQQLMAFDHEEEAEKEEHNEDDDEYHPHDRRQLLLYPEDIGNMDKALDDHHQQQQRQRYYDRDEDDDTDGAMTYYSKDGGQWKSVQQHLHKVANPKNFIPRIRKPFHYSHHDHHRHLRAPKQAHPDMTEAEMSAIREEAREDLVNALRQAAREEENNRKDESVSKSLESIMGALALRPPASFSPEKKETLLKPSAGIPLPEVENPLGRRRRHLRGLQALQQQGAGAAVIGALANSLTEAQKAEMRQVVYDATLNLMREAARQAFSGENGDSNGNSNNNNYATAAHSYANPAGSKTKNQDAYAAAVNAMVNALSSSKQAATDNNGAIASHGGPGGFAPTPGPPAKGGGGAVRDHVAAARAKNIDAGTGAAAAGGSQERKSLLEIAREVARRKSPSAGRPPAYADYPAHRHTRKHRGLKDASFRIPIPFTRDPLSNGSTPLLVYNATNAVFVPLSRYEGNDGDAEFGPLTPPIGPIGPVISGPPAAIREFGGVGSGGSGGKRGVNNPGASSNHKKEKGDWAEMLLDLVHQHQAKQREQAEQRGGNEVKHGHGNEHGHEQGYTQRLLQQEQTGGGGGTKGAKAGVASPTTTTTTAPATTDAQTQTQTEATTTTAPAPASAPAAPSNPNLDLDALAGVIQRPFAAIPGSIYTDPNKPSPHQTDANGNLIQKMFGGLGGEGGGDKQGLDTKFTRGGDDIKQKQHPPTTTHTEKDQRNSIGDGFYDRASTQLLSHSARNFKKMQDAVRSIMAQEGVMNMGGWEEEAGDEFGDLEGLFGGM